MFARLGVMTACRFTVTSACVCVCVCVSAALDEDKCAAVFAFVPDCQCVYSAVCDVISQSVSYDLPEPDEVLSTAVGVQ